MTPVPGQTPVMAQRACPPSCRRRLKGHVIVRGGPLLWLIASLLLIAGCGWSVPAPPPPDTSPGRAAPDVDEVVQKLGYALAPEYVPAGLQVSNVRVSGSRALIAYGDKQDRLLVAYPVPFAPEDTPIMKELGLIRPREALSEVKVGRETAYLVTGGWSEDTIRQGPGINPNEATWDYDASLTLFFDYQLPGQGKVGVAIQAMANPSEWITKEEVVKIGESLRLAN